MTLLVRDESDDDHEAVRRIHRAAFPGPEEAELVDALRRDADPIVSLVAVEGTRAVGHILFSPITVDDRRDQGEPLRLGLAPVGVLPDHQGHGIGARLIEVGLVRCRDLGAVGVVLLGDPGYYGRFGFVAASTFGLHSKFTNEATAPAFQAIELRSGGLTGLTPGAVEYHPAFDGL